MAIDRIHDYIVPGKRAHLVGIGGVSMSPLAEVLQGEGLIISGSDMKESPAVEHLRSLGIPVTIGHLPENVAGKDLVIRTAAVHDDNPEIAAARALADLALEPVPEDVRAAYHGRDFTFGPDYVIPMPLDPRIIEWVAPAVASAAVESGVARGSMEDIGGSVEAYRVMLRERMSKARARMASYWESYNK